MPAALDIFVNRFLSLTLSLYLSLMKDKFCMITFLFSEACTISASEAFELVGVSASADLTITDNG